MTIECKCIKTVYCKSTNKVMYIVGKSYSFKGEGSMLSALSELGKAYIMAPYYSDKSDRDFMSQNFNIL